MSVVLPILGACSLVPALECDAELVYSGEYFLLAATERVSPTCDAWATELTGDQVVYAVDVDMAFACSAPVPSLSIGHSAVTLVPDGAGFAVEEGVFLDEAALATDSAYSAFWGADAPAHLWTGSFGDSGASFDTFDGARLNGAGSERFRVDSWASGAGLCGDVVVQGVAEGVQVGDALEDCPFTARVFFTPLPATVASGDVLHTPPDCVL